MMKAEGKTAERQSSAKLLSEQAPVFLGALMRSLRLLQCTRTKTVHSVQSQTGTCSRRDHRITRTLKTARQTPRLQSAPSYSRPCRSSTRYAKAVTRSSSTSANSGQGQPIIATAKTSFFISSTPLAKMSRGGQPIDRAEGTLRPGQWVRRCRKLDYSVGAGTAGASAPGAIGSGAGLAGCSAPGATSS